MKILGSRILLSFILLLLSGSLSAAPELKGTPDELKAFLHPEEKTVVIRGTAEETAYSDLAHVTLVVSTKEKTMTSALKKNSELRATLVENFIRSGIPPNRISNTQFSSSPQYGLFGRKPKEYEVVNRLKVTVDDEDQLTLLAQAADQHEETSIGGIEFEHSVKKETEQKLREAALEDAIATGSAYASKLGLILRPISFHYADVRPQRPRSAGIIEEIVVTAQRSKGDTSSAYMAPPVTFDEVEYKSNVEVVFEVSLGGAP